MASKPASRSRGSAPVAKRQGWWGRMWQPFWMLPTVLTLLAGVIGIALPEIDRYLEEWVVWLFPGGADAARGALTTIASVTIATVGVVFSITMVVLQLASSQFTPRVLSTFLHSRIVQVTFGLYIATFVFSLVALRPVLGEQDGSQSFVPRVSVAFAFLLALVCVALLLVFIRYITESIQVSQVISRIGRNTKRLLDEVMPGTDNPAAAPTWSPRQGTPRTRIAVDDRYGHVDEVHLPGLVHLAAEHDGVLVMDSAIGDFTTSGQQLATFWGDEWPDKASERVNHCVNLATDRSMRQDVTFGVRQLVDIAERALSPGINDPTTAIQVIDELHRMLRAAVQRTAPSPYVADDKGVVRVVMRGADAGTLLQLSVEEIAHYGRDDVQVPRRLTSMLNDLGSCALPQYHEEIARLKKIVADGDGVPQITDA